MTRYKSFTFYATGFFMFALVLFLPFFVFAGLEDGGTVVVTLEAGTPGGTSAAGAGNQSGTTGAIGSGNPEAPLAPGQPPPVGTPPPPPAATTFTISGLLTRAEGILNLIIPFIIGLAVVAILWGIFLYVTKAAEEEKRAEARLYIVWGVVAVFSMLSLWGFVNILVNTFDLQTTFDKGSVPTAPTL
jgi:hypothetical protein